MNVWIVSNRETGSSIFNEISNDAFELFPVAIATIHFQLRHDATTSVIRGEPRYRYVVGLLENVNYVWK